MNRKTKTIFDDLYVFSAVSAPSCLKFNPWVRHKKTVTTYFLVFLEKVFKPSNASLKFPREKISFYGYSS